MIQLSDITAAQERLKKFLFLTPLERSSELEDGRGLILYSKLETLQRTGSFKIRGALNKILTLSTEERKRGVIAASMGNHAQGVALAAKLAGIQATIVMPASAPLVKLENTRSLGAQVLEQGHSFEESLREAERLSTEKKLVFIPAFDDEQVIAGQGTIGLEVLKQLPSVDEIVVPIGGGGLIAGIATAVKGMNPKVTVTGVQAANRTQTFADGIRVHAPGKICQEVIRRTGDQIGEVGDD